jgi:hypothetical protein
MHYQAAYLIDKQQRHMGRSFMVVNLCSPTSLAHILPTYFHLLDFENRQCIFSYFGSSTILSYCNGQSGASCFNPLHDLTPRHFFPCFFLCVPRARVPFPLSVPETRSPNLSSNDPTPFCRKRRQKTPCLSQAESAPCNSSASIASLNLPHRGADFAIRMWNVMNRIRTSHRLRSTGSSGNWS